MKLFGTSGLDVGVVDGVVDAVDGTWSFCPT
jgi:hypothetical protein